MILATDLDGTFLGGNESQKQLLYSFFRNNPDNQLIFVSGRGLDSVRYVLSDLKIPRPDYIISDVGATIVNGTTWQPVEPLQSDIAAKWPGNLKIAEKLDQIAGLVLQEVPQHRRCSYYADNESVVEQVKANLSSIPCEIIYSANKFLDILPHGVNKGNSLKALINHLDQDPSEVMVAGDTLNDLSMFQCGFKGVVVGNSENRLMESINGINEIFVAVADGAGGILEALLQFKIMRAQTKDFI